MNNETRRIDLSNKILKMGQSLVHEGNSSQDIAIMQSGTMLILLAGLLLDENDMFIFSELCAMFSAKKILDAHEGVSSIENETFAKILALKGQPQPPEKKTRKPRKPRGDKPKE